VPFGYQKGAIPAFYLIPIETFRFGRRWFGFIYGQDLTLVQIGSSKIIETLDLFGSGPILFGDGPERVAFLDDMDYVAVVFGFGDFGGLIAIASLRYFE
jgi:hypothetical protein